MVPNAATPTRRTAKGLSVFLFINPYRSKCYRIGIIEKFNQLGASSVTTVLLVTRARVLFDHHEQFIVS